MTKVYIWPTFDTPDAGHGGVRRVVEAQRRYLPDCGIEVVETPDEADVLAAHIMAPPRLFDRYPDKPLVAHNHGFYWSEYPWPGGWAEKDNAEVMRLVKAADITTAPSEWVAAIIRRHSSRDVRTIYHGIDQVERSGLGGSYVLWNKTRVDPVCDPRPVRELAARLPHVEFHTTFWDEYGTDPHLPNVTLLGRQPHEDAMEEVRNARVYLCTTRETFGIGTLEALACGVPIVGWDIGGQAEIVRHLVTGYLAREGDYEDLATGIEWALTHYKGLAIMAEEAAADFLWADIMPKYADLYREAVQRRRESESPRVSVIVTSYNLARFLPDCLASVQTQTMTDWECIVVDDASPDDSGDVATAWAEANPRFRVIRNETNQYLAEARNTGIREARGRYILPLDADDMLAPRTLEALATELDRDRLLHIAYGNVLFVDEDGRTPTHYPGGPSAGHSGWPQAFSLATFMDRPGQPLPYCSMFRRDAWALTGGYRRRVRSSEDCDMWMRLTSYGFTARMVTNGDTLIYRNRPDSMSRTTGWADEENKAWFPWRRAQRLLPAAGWDRPDLLVPSLDPPVVSVIIPVGPGHAHLVKDAVDSVEAQVFREWECVVVNDTGEPLPELPSWVRVVALRRHGGVSIARNAGAELARGRFLLFLDADDYLMPQALTGMVASADDNTTVYADCWQNAVQDPDAWHIQQMPDYDPTILLGKTLHAVTALYPAEAFRAVGGFSAGVPWEDWDLQLKLARVGYCGRRLASPVWAYRMHLGARREDREDRKADARADMYSLWRDYFEGRKQLMACSACQQRARSTTVYQASRMGSPTFYEKPEFLEGKAKLLEHTNARGGKITLRGKATNLPYNFQTGRPRWVDDERRGPGGMTDADFFLTVVGIVDRTIETNVSDTPQDQPDAPVLVAPGPPRRDEQPMSVARPVRETLTDRPEVATSLNSKTELSEPLGRVGKVGQLVEIGAEAEIVLNADPPAPAPDTGLQAQADAALDQAVEAFGAQRAEGKAKRTPRKGSGQAS